MFRLESVHRIRLVVGLPRRTSGQSDTRCTLPGLVRGSPAGCTGNVFPKLLTCWRHWSYHRLSESNRLLIWLSVHVCRPAVSLSVRLSLSIKPWFHVKIKFFEIILFHFGRGSVLK